jgi:hypothetical protein
MSLFVETAVGRQDRAAGPRLEEVTVAKHPARVRPAVSRHVERGRALRRAERLAGALRHVKRLGGVLQNAV